MEGRVAHAGEREEALPQLLGEFAPVDVWQQHMNTLFYGLRGHRVRELYQTFAAADYRLGYALATDYVRRALQRHKAKPETADVPLTIMEWGGGNGNLAACFLDRVKALDHDAVLYPRLTYRLMDASETVLESAKANADLANHHDRVRFMHATVKELARVPDGSVDRILCNELWNELPTKLVLRKAGQVQEEHLRPNLKETRLHDFPDWAGLVQAFGKADVAALTPLPEFLDDVVWEREYHPIEAKDLPFRRLITDVLHRVDEEVLIPANVGAALSLKEAQRLMAPDALGFSSFDAGTAEAAVLNDPDKPCCTVLGGQWSFMVNVVLLEEVAKQLGAGRVSVEPQKEFIGRNLGAKVMSLTDVLASHPNVPEGEPWKVDQLLLNTMAVLNAGEYTSPYERTLHFPIDPGTPEDTRREVQRLLAGLDRHGVADTVAYVTEQEVMSVADQLETFGYDRRTVHAALTAPPQPVDYFHFHVAAG